MKKTIKDYKEENKRLRKYNKFYRIINFIYLFFFIFNIIITIHTYNLISNINNLEISLDIDISLAQLTETQYNLAYQIIDDVKDEYWIGQKSITFVQNKLTKNSIGNNLDEDSIGHNANGHIIILYNDDETELRKTLCHELLHTYFQHNEIAHRIIYDIDDYLVCYKGSEK